MPVARHSLQHLRRKTFVLRAENESVARFERRFRVSARARRFHNEGPRVAQRREALVDIDMRAHFGQRVVIEAGATHGLQADVESERLHQVERAPGVGAQANDVARIRRNLGLDEDDVKHGALL